VTVGWFTQRKTGRPDNSKSHVTRQSVERLLASQPSADGYLFGSRTHERSHISTRQYARIVHQWIGNIGLDDRGFGTHSLRRTKVAQLYRRTGNLRAVQLLLGHAKIETTVRYLGVEVDDALRLAEQIEL
jgi:integrase